MIFSNKSLSTWIIGSSLFVSTMAWAESGCMSQDCGQMAVQVEQLRSQIGDDHATIKKLQTDLTLARQDISLLQNSSQYQARTAGHISRTANGHGR
jgi:hypothetical protein